MNPFEALVADLEQEALLYADMLELARELGVLAALDPDEVDWDAFLELLERRQELARRIDGLQEDARQRSRALGILQAGDAARVLDPGQQRRLGRQVQAVRELVEALAARDEETVRALRAGIARVEARLGQARGARKALQAYGPGAGPPEAWFFDRKK
ncbi:MAG: hypothetical protein NUV35_00335 [Syntrophomonadaceae bacterium]|nr:hypothetical protein [Syntrophomonadaceae bacterium]